MAGVKGVAGMVPPPIGGGGGGPKGDPGIPAPGVPGGTPVVPG